MANDKTYIASCSFGKDSLATILLALEHGEPLDRVVFCEVMFDHERGISGEIPEHIEWIYGTAIPRLRAMGLTVDVVRSDKDYMSCFYRQITERSKKFRGGAKTGFSDGRTLHNSARLQTAPYAGFPLGDKCEIRGMCKMRAAKRYIRQFGIGVIQYLGIAVDEPERLARCTGNKVSLLAKYGYTERMAKELCEQHGLLSPIYETGTRGGCWFCPNAKIRHFCNLRRNHPELWQELVELSHTPNLCSYGFKYGMTVQDVERRMEWHERQLELF